MSLFSSLGQGDIWSISGISFASPINDILDKEFYTLEELLEEDDLLQEVKSKNERLLNFLQSADTIDKLVSYIVTTAEPGANDLRLFKYPYMSCELFCCEIPKILDILVEEQDGRLLHSLFSLLDHSSPLDHYLAGYFEKLLEMLFRRMTVPLMAYLNKGGINLLQKFLNHIENYSIMQIVQRVMLPHIPFSMDDVEVMSPAEKLNYQCNWSFQRETCFLLCSRMLSGESPDIPSHISDLLITVLQLSPHDSLFLTRLCESQCLDDLLKYSFQDYAERKSVTDALTIESSVSLASLSVLESLISRLCETLNPFEPALDKDPSVDDSVKTMVLIGQCVDRVSAALISYVPKFARQLTAYCEADVCGSFVSQTQQSYRRLGQRGLQLVKLVEAIVRLANDEIDSALCSSGALKACVDLMLQYNLNSLLHLSVQRIILILIEGGATKSTIHCLLVDCGLLRKIIEVVSEENAGSDGFATEEEVRLVRSKSQIAGSRRPIIGHIISIAQSIVGALQAERVDADSSVDVSHDVSSDSVDEEGGGQVKQSPQKSLVKSVLEEAHMLGVWEAFVESELRRVLDKQSAAYCNMDAKTETSTPETTKLSQMEAALEALAMKDNNWLKRNDDDVQNNVFDDENDGSDDSDDSDDDDYHGGYKQSRNFSSQIKVTAVIRDEEDKDFAKFDDFDIGDQFAKFSSSTQSFADFSSSGSAPSFEANFDNISSSVFEANFDNVATANFGVNFESPQFDNSSGFETNFENFSTSEDLFADFAKESHSEGNVDFFADNTITLSEEKADVKD